MYSRLLSPPLLALIFLASLAACSSDESVDTPSSSLAIADYEAYDGFIDMYWDSTGGRLLIKVEELDTPVL